MKPRPRIKQLMHVRLYSTTAGVKFSSLPSCISVYTVLVVSVVNVSFLLLGAWPRGIIISPI